MLIWQKALSRLVFVKSMALQGKREQEKGGSERLRRESEIKGEKNQSPKVWYESQLVGFESQPKGNQSPKGI